ncbi:MAG: right-handed parallel beta-helix repeat-containing protein [Phycisphaerae bacterium]|jgi:hypothetical protein|nr:right-handed parallel beta-helix repeat-containing protein [Phycisphaerae bacterium]
MSLKRANDTLLPGDVATLLDGTYTHTPIAPARSGTKGKSITYRAANRYKAIFTEDLSGPKFRGAAAIVASGRSHITIDGIKAVDVKRWLIGAKCSHIALSNCRFEKSTGWINCRFEDNGDGIRLIGNYFNEGTDLVSIDGGDGHLVEGNFFGDATHTGLVLLGVRRSVVRGNRLSNRRWRCMEVESRRRKPYRLSEYNLIEGNVFDYSPCSAIQYAGNRSIIRRNIIRRCLTGMNWANYVGSNKGSKKRSPEAWHDENNRFYNNVIDQCGPNATVRKLIAQARAAGFAVAENKPLRGYAMVFATNMFNPKLKGYDNCAYGDNVVMNNIFYRNGSAVQGSDKKGKTASQTTHVAFDWNATPEFGRFAHNIFSNGPIVAAATPVFYFCDAPYLRPPEPRNRSVKSFQKRYPKWARDNTAITPGFLAADRGDYRLGDKSACIDAGGPLTSARLAGKGKTIPVRDALFFSDGHSLVEPDVIFVGTQRVKIVKVDYEARTITVDRSISWQKGTPVTLDYKGKAPDIGAYEAR